MNMKGVFNKVIVTGGGRGIGKEIARMFAENGAFVIIADRDKTAGNECVESLSYSGKRVRFFHSDVSVPSEVSAMIRESTKMMGGIDILINNAGFGIWKSPLEITIDEWDSVINTNLRGTFLCSREAAKIMKVGGGGCIINIASTRALMSEPDSEAYAASKGGILSLTHALAASLAKYKIRVNCISPGWIETGDYNKLREIDHIQHFSGRVGMPADIGRACIFLAENDFINASNIIIDGGITRKMIYEP